MMLFGRFRSMGHFVLQLISLSSQTEDLTIHDESKDNADMPPSFQQFISDPTISGRISKSEQHRLWWLDVRSEAN